MRILNAIVALLLLASCADDIEASVQLPSTTVTISGTLPVMYIETENRTPITSKTDYLGFLVFLFVDVYPVFINADGFSKEI